MCMAGVLNRGIMLKGSCACPCAFLRLRCVCNVLVLCLVYTQMWHVRGGRENMWVKVKKTQQETQQENRNTGKGKEEFLQPYNIWIYFRRDIWGWQFHSCAVRLSREPSKSQKVFVLLKNRCRVPHGRVVQRQIYVGWFLVWANMF